MTASTNDQSSSSPPDQATPKAPQETTPSATNNNKRTPRIIRRKNKTTKTTATHHLSANEIPPHIQNNTQLHRILSTTLPADYEFEIPKTIWRIEKSNARHVALQLPEGLLMYASTIGDILIKFAYKFRSLEETGQTEGEGGEGESSSRPTCIQSLSILGDVTYGACCIDDLSARALGCDLLVHYGHSCLVPLTCTVIPCLYVFVEIRVDVKHLVDCFRMTFADEERARREALGEDEEGKGGEPNGTTSTTTTTTTRVIETLCMGTVQFRSAVVEASQRLNGEVKESSPSSDMDASADIIAPSSHQVQFQAIVPQAKPLSPGEVLGCTAPSGLAQLNFQQAMMSTSQRRQARKLQGATATSSGDAAADESSTDNTVAKERVMLFLADERFHLEAAMISNPSLRALRYDPYSKTLTEERYEIVKMKRLRREAIQSARKILGISPLLHPSSSIDVVKGIAQTAAQSGDDIANSILQDPSMPSSSMLHKSNSSTPKTMGIILGTLGRQGNPAILSRIRSLLHSRGIRSIIVLLSEIFPKKLAMLSNPSADGGGVCAWVQIACPRLSIDWGHYFCVPVLSPFELFVALGEVVDSSLWVAGDERDGDVESKIDEKEDEAGGYPMDFYSKGGGPWTNYYDSNKERKVVSYGA